VHLPRTLLRNRSLLAGIFGAQSLWDFQQEDTTEQGVKHGEQQQDFPP
jgi:hypothetical protein